MSLAWRPAARMRRRSAASGRRPWRARCWLTRHKSAHRMRAPDAWPARAPAPRQRPEPPGTGTTGAPPGAVPPTGSVGSVGTGTGSGPTPSSAAEAAGAAASATPATQVAECAAKRRFRALESMRDPPGSELPGRMTQPLGPSPEPPAAPVLDLTNSVPTPRLGVSRLISSLQDSAHAERLRRGAAHLDGDLPQARALPRAAHHPEHDDVVQLVAVAVPAPQHALALEAHALERGLRAAVAGVRPGGEAVEAERLERQRGDERLRLEVCARAPEGPAEPRADRRAAVAGGELGQPRHADRAVLAVVDEELEHLAALPLAGQRRDVGLRLLDARVRTPREVPRDGCIRAQLEQPRGIIGLRVAERQRRARDGERSWLGHRADAIHAAGASSSDGWRTRTPGRPLSSRPAVRPPARQVRGAAKGVRRLTAGVRQWHRV